MSRSFLVILFTLATYVLSTPLSSPSSESLEKRVTHAGSATWFAPGVGNCGFSDSEYDPIVAISKQIYKGGDNCNQWVRITNAANGKSAYGKVRDSCPGCHPDNLDLSPSLFKAIAPLDKGVVKIKWNFMPKGWKP